MVLSLFFTEQTRKKENLSISKCYQVKITCKHAFSHLSLPFSLPLSLPPKATSTTTINHLITHMMSIRLSFTPPLPPPPPPPPPPSSVLILSLCRGSIIKKTCTFTCQGCKKKEGEIVKEYLFFWCLPQFLLLLLMLLLLLLWGGDVENVKVSMALFW